MMLLHIEHGGPEHATFADTLVEQVAISADAMNHGQTSGSGEGATFD